MLQPDEVSRLLDLRPTRTHLRGQPRGISGESAKHFWNRSLWSLESPLSEDGDLAEQLKWLLNSLEPRLSVIKELALKYHVDLFCGF
jgi:hypothetical protein